MSQLTLKEIQSAIKGSVELNDEDMISQQQAIMDQLNHSNNIKQDESNPIVEALGAINAMQAAYQQRPSQVRDKPRNRSRSRSSSPPPPHHHHHHHSKAGDRLSIDDVPEIKDAPPLLQDPEDYMTPGDNRRPSFSIGDDDDVDPDSFEGGYDLQSFELQLDQLQNYLCRLCGSVARNAVELKCPKVNLKSLDREQLINKAPPTHFFCSSCLEQYVGPFQANRCPLDNAELSLSMVKPSKWWRKKIGELYVRCSASAQTKDFADFGDSSLRNGHEVCGKRLKLKDLKDHLFIDCMYRFVRCPICEEAIQASFLSSHKKAHLQTVNHSSMIKHIEALFLTCEQLQQEKKELELEISQHNLASSSRCLVLQTPDVDDQAKQAQQDEYDRAEQRHLFTTNFFSRFTWDTSLHPERLGLISDGSNLSFEVPKKFKFNRWVSTGGTVIWSTGSHYFEVVLDVFSPQDKQHIAVGIVPASFSSWNRGPVMGYHDNGPGWCYLCTYGVTHSNGHINREIYGQQARQGDVIGVRVTFPDDMKSEHADPSLLKSDQPRFQSDQDRFAVILEDIDSFKVADNANARPSIVSDSQGTIEFFHNGVSLGVAYSNIRGAVRPAISLFGHCKVSLLFNNPDYSIPISIQ